MSLPAPVAMNINDFNVGSIDNYEDVREYSISPNKATSRTVSMYLSKASEEYAIRVEWLNNILDDEEIRESINSSNLSYAKPSREKIQISRTTNHENRMRKQWGIEKAPTLKSTPEQCVNDNDVINI